MTEEQFVLNNKSVEFVKPKKISHMKTGDKVKIVTSEGYIIGEGIIEREVNSYVVLNGEKYWKRGIDGKHRKRTNYLEFLMTPKDANEYKVKNNGSSRNPHTV